MDRCRTIDVPIIEFFSENVNLKARATRLIRQILHNETEVYSQLDQFYQSFLFLNCEHLFWGAIICSVVIPFLSGDLSKNWLINR